MKIKWLIGIGFILLASCRKNYDAIVPDSSWNIFNGADSIALTQTTRQTMEGVYSVQDGSGDFGNQIAQKWSFVVEGNDTTYHLSVFAGLQNCFFILSGKRFGDSLLLNGYWHKLSSAETGIVRFVINQANGAAQLLSSSPMIGKDSILMSGVYGHGQENPGLKIVFRYLRPLYKARPFDILAHRSGGRTSDLLPYSENSIGMIKFAEQLGATGIEIDIRLTKDKVPILYHDNTLNLRLVKEVGLVGPVENYTYDQLQTYVRLLDGENIPTLKEALDAVITHTSLDFVWLDTKYTDSLHIIEQIQEEYIQMAASMGRNLQITIGLPGEDQVQKFQELPNYTQVPSLCELSPGEAESLNSKEWAPRFTLGLQNDQVAAVHAEGRKAFVWTLDVPDLIQQFVSKGNFDGILTNYSTVVAYYYYVRE
jgi:glycerophosphoryl diester phosphodiesterase